MFAFFNHRSGEGLRPLNAHEWCVNGVVCLAFLTGRNSRETAHCKLFINNAFPHPYCRRQNAKLWSKYIKDIMVYIEKRINYEMESSKNLLKLAQTIRPALGENDNLPLQQLYLNMLDLDIKNHKAYFANCSLILGRCLLSSWRVVHLSPLDARSIASKTNCSTVHFLLISERFINNFTIHNLGIGV